MKLSQLRQIIREELNSLNEKKDDIYFVAKEQNGKYIVKKASENSKSSKTGNLKFKTKEEADKKAKELNLKK